LLVSACYPIYEANGAGDTHDDGNGSA